MRFATECGIDRIQSDTKYNRPRRHREWFASQWSQCDQRSSAQVDYAEIGFSELRGITPSHREHPNPRMLLRVRAIAFHALSEPMEYRRRGSARHQFAEAR